jgi:deoxyribonucleoside regulator
LDNERLSKLTEVAKLYYQYDFSQQKIAEKLGISRSSISRLLQEAKELGIVNITIADPTKGTEKTARKLEEKYKLKTCIVVPVPSYKDQHIKVELGKVAAEYIGQIVEDHDIIGTTWGTTLYEVAKRVQPKMVRDVTVVQLNGGISYSESNTYAAEILNYFSDAFNTVPHFLPLPAIFDQKLVADAILSDRHIKRVLDLGKQCNIAIYTVGDINEQSSLFKAEYYTKNDLMDLKEKGAVGDICSRIFDQQGSICNVDLDNRTIGIQLKELSTKRDSILIAGGMEKVDGIYGALRGKFPNVLIIDEFTAHALLEKEEV